MWTYKGLISKNSMSEAKSRISEVLGYLRKTTIDLLCTYYSYKMYFKRFQMHENLFNINCGIIKDYFPKILCPKPNPKYPKIPQWTQDRLLYTCYSFTMFLNDYWCLWTNKTVTVVYYKIFSRNSMSGAKSRI